MAAGGAASPLLALVVLEVLLVIAAVALFVRFA
jgi:hypothetical protein